jgi:hypothetical protein
LNQATFSRINLWPCSATITTAKGHMNPIRQHICSTQPAVVEPTPESDMVQEDKCNFICAAIMETNQIYTYLTGRFPTTSLIGNKYILILYYYDSNSVLSAPIKNRGDKDMVRAFDLLIQSLIICGLKPSVQRLDNEASLALRNYLTKQGIDYQLAPLYIHRRMNYGLTPNCNLSQSRHGHTPITCAHTTGNIITYLSQVSYRNLLRSQYKQGCN